MRSVKNLTKEHTVLIGYFSFAEPENGKKKSSDESPGESDTETLDVTIDIDDDDATVEHEAGEDSERDSVNDYSVCLSIC